MTWRPLGVARHTARWILVLLTLLAFGRGIWALGAKSLWWDESLSLHRVEGSLPFTLSSEILLTDNVTTLPTVDNHPPLYFTLLWFSVRLWGRSEFALRFLSLAAVTLIVPLLYLAGRRLVDRPVGLFAAALGALSPMYLWYAQEARMYALVAVLSLLSFCFFVRAFFSPGRVPRWRADWPSIVGYILASALVILTHHLGSLLVAFQLLALGILFLRRMASRRVLIVTTAALAVVSLASLVRAVLNLPNIPSNRAGFRFVPLPDLLRDLLNSFSLGLSVDVGRWYVFAIDLVFLGVLFVGVVWLLGSDRRRTAGWLLLGYLFVPTALIYGLSFVQPAYMNSRHLILITPAFYLLVASGLSRLWQPLRGGGESTGTGVAGSRARAVGLLVGLVLLAGVSHSTWNYFADPRYDKDHHREWGAYLREHVRPGDVVVVDPPHIEELYHYYAGLDVPWVGLPLLHSPGEETVAKFQELAARFDRIWLAFSHTPPWGDRRRFPEQWLNENAFRVDYKEFESYASVVLVACYLPRRPVAGRLPPPDDMQRVGVRFSPALRLEGFRPVSIARPGGSLHVELFWAVDEPIPEEASVVLRLVDANDHLWGQAEQCPFNGLYPLWQWGPGERLVDEHELPVPPGTPPGAYQLEAVLVSRPAEDGCFGPPGQPIPPQSGPAQALRGDRVFLGNVEVERALSATVVDPRELGFKEVRARFDGLELLGVGLTPAALRAGDRLAVGLYWQAIEALLADARFRLRLVDRAGRVWQELTIRPAGDGHPTDLWTAGERFRGQFWLEVPADAAAGRYEVELLPEGPLQRSGLLPALGRTLGLEAGGLLLGRFEVEALAVEPIGPSPNVIPPPRHVDISYPMLATLGDRIRFLGYDLESESVPAGGQVVLTLYWQALAPMETSYTVFTHLLGPANEILGQHDSPPQGGAYPTTLWQPGEVIADVHGLAVEPGTPPGEYLLEVGMYRLPDVTRLPVSDSEGQPVPDDRILLPAVTIVPPPTAEPTRIPGADRVYLPLIRAAR